MRNFARISLNEDFAYRDSFLADLWRTVMYVVTFGPFMMLISAFHFSSNINHIMSLVQ